MNTGICNKTINLATVDSPQCQSGFSVNRRSTINPPMNIGDL